MARARSWMQFQMSTAVAELVGAGWDFSGDPTDVAVPLTYAEGDAAFRLDLTLRSGERVWFRLTGPDGRPLAEGDAGDDLEELDATLFRHRVPCLSDACTSG